MRYVNINLKTLLKAKPLKEVIILTYLKNSISDFIEEYPDTNKTTIIKAMEELLNNMKK